jgi:hypothetical protein
LISYLPTSIRLMGCFALLACAAPLAGYAQSPADRQSMETERRRQEQQRYDREFENRTRDLRNLGDRRVASRASGLSSYSTPRLTEEQKQLLEPTAADRAAFASFLRQPDTGLVRLLPREKYDHTTAMPLRGGGAYYSFFKLSHEAGPWSDIRFQNGELHVGFNDMTLGLITKLGDLPLEDLSASHPAVEFLSNLAVPVKYAELGPQADKNGAGFKAGGLLYKTRVAAQLNTTYMLRSTVYNEADNIIAIRTLRAEPDGSIVLLWKSLSRLKVKKLKDVRRYDTQPIL